MRKWMWLAIVSLLMVGGCHTAETPAPDPDSIGWINLFDGQSLAGWKVNEKPDSFVVADGAIVAKNGPSHLFYVGPTGDAYFKDFEFAADVMAEPHANSGIYFHTKYQDTGWPYSGYECQVNNTHSDWRKTGGLYGVQDIRQETIQEIPLKDNEWFHYYIKVQDKHIIIKINGRTLIDYVEPENVNYPQFPGRKIGGGTFALQGHDPDSVTHYKNIKVRPLP